MPWAGLRLAVTLLTVIPLPAGRQPRRDPAAPDPAGLPPAAPYLAAPAASVCAPTRQQAGAAMCWAPAVGLLLGGIAGGILWVAGQLGRTGPLLAAVLAIAALAALTGGLHLDGLADLADGLGSRRPAGRALEIMKESDIGPFGVAALVLILLIQVAALARADSAGRGVIAVLTAAVGARLAMTVACRRGVPAARGSGLGALVAGSVHPVAAAVLTAAGVAAAAAFGWIFAVAMAAGLVASVALTAAAVRRLGGITGDVLGAIAEVTAAVCLLVTALR
ncbi:MAG TPA: adenosylcobinamide-GDP ribazoletransferase [Streptosporangiaceae bacterium]